MPVQINETSKEFHLFNNDISYIMKVLPTGHLGQLYFGSPVHQRESYDYMLEHCMRPMSNSLKEDDRRWSLEHYKLEFPSFGHTDFRDPAVDIETEEGGQLCDFIYKDYQLLKGKPALQDLPACYVESDGEADTLIIILEDPLTKMKARLLYTIYSDRPVITRSVQLKNKGEHPAYIERIMSLCLDLPDQDYIWMQLSGAWGRERHIVEKEIKSGITAIQSKRGHSSHQQNPFVALKRPHTTECAGEAIGVSLVYSGNFLIEADADTHNTMRLLAGINPDTFRWQLKPGTSFQSPEAVLVFSSQGLNGLSQSLHGLFQKRLARGCWRDRPRPILNNNWEATYFDFDEAKLLDIARKAKETGVELFVLDDGWFGQRTDDHAGLGDWYPNLERLPEGIAGLSRKIEDLGLKFGLWFEPEMVNKDSDLYRAHPDWILAAPGRTASQGRYQYVLDFSRPEVVDAVYEMMHKILAESKISYIKWDMNRSISECFSAALPKERQGEVYHRYILGVYDLYERLIRDFPEILFESCASGGARFDPGMLYYAPQAWTSDDSDAIERLKIQYGTSLAYPISSIGAHVSVTPNHQLRRSTPLHTRANVACFGTFGYELDLNALSPAEIEEVKQQIEFMKENRELLQFGTFYRLKSPFEGNITAWMSVAPDKGRAIVGWYRTLNDINYAFERLKLEGLDPNKKYRCQNNGQIFYGDELMNFGLITTDSSCGQADFFPGPESVDFDSKLFILEAVE